MTFRPAALPSRVAAGVAGLVLLVGAAWITRTLFANQPGDAGPVVGPGAAEKVQYGVLAGLVVVALAAAVGAASWWVARRASR